MATLTQLVKRKLDKRSKSRKSMTKKKGSSQVVVLRPSMRERGRTAGIYARHYARRAKEGIFGGSKKLKAQIDPYANALGWGTIAVAGYSKVQPNGSMQTAQLVGLAGEYYGGGIKGAIGAEVIKSLVGAPSIFSGLNLGGILGGGGNSQMQQTGGGLL